MKGEFIMTKEIFLERMADILDVEDEITLDTNLSELDECAVASWEYKLASDVLPLPVDQRYDCDDMEYIEKIFGIIKSNIYSGG